MEKVEKKFGFSFDLSSNEPFEEVENVELELMGVFGERGFNTSTAFSLTL